MTSIIIYEDDTEMQKLYQEVIKNFFNKRNKKEKFYIFSSYTKKLEEKFLKIPDKKIFILDIEVPGKSGLDLARNIRSQGDWMSPLIMITNYDNLKKSGFTSKILMLDFISKKENIALRLQDSLEIAYKMICKKETYTFQYNGELFHIPFEEILYFEKDLNDNYTFLYTDNSIYKIKESIIQISNHLNYYPDFFKINRSCIVNIKKIHEFNLKENYISFGKYSTHLFNKKSKELLRKKLKSYQIIQ